MTNDVMPDDTDLFPPDNRPWWKRHWMRLAGLGIMLAIVLGVGLIVGLSSDGPTPVPPLAAAAAPVPAAPTPAPLAVAPPRRVPLTMAPALAEAYASYRFAHFLHEYETCLGADREGSWVEAEVLEHLPWAVQQLFEAYDSGTCLEEGAVGEYPTGRGRWLRYWEGKLPATPVVAAAELEPEAAP